MPVPIPIPDLAQYLLTQRHRLSGDTITDCIALALLWNQAPTARITWHQLGDCWGTGSHSYVSKRMRKLIKAGLISYDVGTLDAPGYLIHRIGPCPVSTPSTPPLAHSSSTR